MLFRSSSGHVFDLHIRLVNGLIGGLHTVLSVTKAIVLNKRGESGLSRLSRFILLLLPRRANGAGDTGTVSSDTL